MERLTEIDYSEVQKDQNILNWYYKTSKDLGIDLITLLTILTRGAWAKAEYEEPKFYMPSLIRIHRLIETSKEDKFYIFFTYGIETHNWFDTEKGDRFSKEGHATEKCICFPLNEYGLNKYNKFGFALTKEELEK